MHRPVSHLRQLLLGAVVAAWGCGSNVQELGRPGESVTEVAPSPSGLVGDPTLIPPPRELACPLSRPIEGDACGVENGAPCTFVGAPEASPDQAATPIEHTTTFCICTAERRWSCLQGIVMKSLLAPLRTGDACESGLVVERVGSQCSCGLSGVAWCEP
jgi:hypothetical protein